jgi:hypothetical protein
MLNADDEYMFHHHWYITPTGGNIQGFGAIFGHDFQNFKVADSHVDSAIRGRLVSIQRGLAAAAEPSTISTSSV